MSCHLQLLLNLCLLDTRRFPLQLLCYSSTWSGGQGSSQYANVGAGMKPDNSSCAPWHRGAAYSVISAGQCGMSKIREMLYNQYQNSTDIWLLLQEQSQGQMLRHRSLRQRGNSLEGVEISGTERQRRKPLRNEVWQCCDRWRCCGTGHTLCREQPFSFCHNGHQTACPLNLTVEMTAGSALGPDTVWEI